MNRFRSPAFDGAGPSAARHSPAMRLGTERLTMGNRRTVRMTALDRSLL